MVDSTSPRWGEKACYYSGVCLEAGEVEAMEIAGNSNAETSTAFLRQLRENHPGPLVVIWDNGPAHRGAAIRSYLTTSDLQLRLVALPAYSPDFNADEAVWDWAREEVTANECLGTKAQVQEKMNQFFGGLAHRKEEVKRRCRTPVTGPSRCFDLYTCRAFAITAQCSSHLGFGLVRSLLSVPSAPKSIQAALIPAPTRSKIPLISSGPSVTAFA